MSITEALRKENAALRAEDQRLQAQLGKDSTNSSQLPSSDTASSDASAKRKQKRRKKRHKRHLV
jgi:hypothetical protein